MSLSPTAPQYPVAEPAAAGVVPVRFLHWGPILSGAFVAAACFFVAMAFATAIGLAVSSASPTWRDTSVGLVVLSGAWIVLTAIGSFALGGYVAGRARPTLLQGAVNEVHFRDGAYGLVVWGVGVVLGVALTVASAAVLPHADRTANTASATTEPAFLTYEIDRLFRSDARPGNVDPESRAEAGRILQRGVGKNQLATEDRDYLTRLVAAHAGLAPNEAGQRVTQVVAAARTAASQARKSAIIIGFTLAAALVAAAGAAWACAIMGGRHRDDNVAPSLYFRRA